MKKINIIYLFLAQVLGSNFNSALAQLNPLSAGTIPAGDSIVIKYNVTINNPLVPPSTTQINNQGSVTGSNFSNVLTDDPDSGPSGDATITLLNVFPLPVFFISVKAYQQNTGIRVEWVTVTEVNVERYEIEKSTDGRQFTSFGTLPARNNNGAGNTTYSFLDIAPSPGNNFYRIRSIDNDGKQKYTQVVNVKIGIERNVFIVAPNPVQNHSLVLQLRGVDKGLYNLSVYSNSGQQVVSEIINHIGGSATETLQLGNIAKGIYQLRITGKLVNHMIKIVVQ